MVPLILLLVLSLAANAVLAAFLWGARYDYRVACKRVDEYRERFLNADDHRLDLIAELNAAKRERAQ